MVGPWLNRRLQGVLAPLSTLMRKQLRSWDSQALAAGVSNINIKLRCDIRMVFDVTVFKFVSETVPTILSVCIFIPSRISFDCSFLSIYIDRFTFKTALQ